MDDSLSFSSQEKHETKSLMSNLLFALIREYLEMAASKSFLSHTCVWVFSFILHFLQKN